MKGGHIKNGTLESTVGKKEDGCWRWGGENGIRVNLGQKPSRIIKKRPKTRSATDLQKRKNCTYNQRQGYKGHTGWPERGGGPRQKSRKEEFGTS